jgi:hypothetical protein
MNISEQQRREAFEKWGKNDSLHLVDFRRTEQGVGRYKDQSTGLAWIVWQAAIKFAEGQQSAKRPLPAPPAEEWVPLTAEDVPPGTFLRLAGDGPHSWRTCDVHSKGIFWGGGWKRWENLMDERDMIKRPGQDWQPCKKLKTPTP